MRKASSETAVTIRHHVCFPFVFGETYEQNYMSVLWRY